MPEVLRRHHSGVPAAAMSSAVDDASLLAEVIDERGGADEKGACRIARLVEEDLIARGWPQDASLGSEVELAERYGVGRAVVREAVRILEVRGTPPEAVLDQRKNRPSPSSERPAGLGQPARRGWVDR